MVTAIVSSSDMKQVRKSLPKQKGVILLVFLFSYYQILEKCRREKATFTAVVVAATINSLFIMNSKFSQESPSTPDVSSQLTAFPWHFIYSERRFFQNPIDKEFIGYFAGGAGCNTFLCKDFWELTRRCKEDMKTELNASLTQKKKEILEKNRAVANRLREGEMKKEKKEDQRVGFIRHHQIGRKDDYFFNISNVGVFQSSASPLSPNSSCNDYYALQDIFWGTKQNKVGPMFSLNLSTIHEQGMLALIYFPPRLSEGKAQLLLTTIIDVLRDNCKY